MTDNGHRALSGEERQALRLLVSSARLRKLREQQEEADRRDAEATKRAARMEARRRREKRAAREHGCRCSVCKRTISLSGFEKAKAEGRKPMCRPCWSKARTGQRRLPVRHCSFCEAPIQDGTYTKAIREGRPPSCRDCRYRRARA